MCVPLCSSRSVCKCIYKLNLFFLPCREIFLFFSTNTNKRLLGFNCNLFHSSSYIYLYVWPKYLRKSLHCLLLFYTDGPVGWGYKIHQLHLCRGLRLPKQLSGCWGSSNARALGNAENPFIAIASRLTLAQSSSTW